MEIFLKMELTKELHSFVKEAGQAKLWRKLKAPLMREEEHQNHRQHWVYWFGYFFPPLLLLVLLSLLLKYYPFRVNVQQHSWDLLIFPLDEWL